MTSTTMAFGRMNISRNRNSWGPISTPVSCHRLEPDEEFIEQYTSHMENAQMKQLDPLKEDLADWFNKTLEINYLNGENLLLQLDNGVVLCHLAQIISDRAKSAINAGIAKGPAPIVRGKCFERAMRGSFFSRDNMANFITFCKSLGIHENLLFESDDLVLHNQPRNVILCLLEVARFATKYGIEPPGLIQLEKEIAEEERINSADSGLGSLLSWQYQASPPPPSLDSSLTMRHSSSTSALSSNTYNLNWNSSPHVILVSVPDHKIDKLHQTTSTNGGASDGVPSDNTEDEWSRGSGEDPDLDIVDTREGSGGSGGGDATTELDRKVQSAARLVQRNCVCSNRKCAKLNVRKVGEGKYNIAGKNVFVRLLKGRHMMVRVGGGWDTLDHFLLRHDPCQVKIVSRDSPDRRPATADATKFLHIRAKYRSPPPRESVTR